MGLLLFREFSEVELLFGFGVAVGHCLNKDLRAIN